MHTFYQPRMNECAAYSYPPYMANQFSTTTSYQPNFDNQRGIHPDHDFSCVTNAPHSLPLYDNTHSNTNDSNFVSVDGDSDLIEVIVHTPIVCETKPEPSAPLVVPTHSEPTSNAPVDENANKVQLDDLLSEMKFLDHVYTVDVSGAPDSDLCDENLYAQFDEYFDDNTIIVCSNVSNDGLVSQSDNLAKGLHENNGIATEQVQNSQSNSASNVSDSLELTEQVLHSQRVAQHSNIVPAIMTQTATCVSGGIFGRDVQLLIDSGAAISVTGIQFYNDIPSQKRPPIQPGAFTNAISANGEKFPLQGVVILPIQLGHSVYDHPVYVSDQLSHDVILGTDFMMAHGAHINYETNTFSCKGSTDIQLAKQLPFNHVARITVSEDCTIPPRSQTMIPCNVCPDKQCNLSQSPPSDHNRDGLIEPDERLGPRFHVVGAHILASKGDGKIPFLLLNPTNETIVLRRKTNVGTFNPIQCASSIVPLEYSQHDGSQTPDQITSVRTSESVNTVTLPDDTEWDIETTGLLGRPPDISTCTKYPALQELNIDISNTDLHDHQLSQLDTLISEYRHVFAKTPHELAATHLVKHDIQTGSAEPVRQRPYRVTPEKRLIIKQHIDEMLAQGIIEPSSSPWASPVVLVPKPDGTMRFYVDYRKLNKLTKKSSWPLPNINDFFQEFGTHKLQFLTCLD